MEQRLYNHHHGMHSNDHPGFCIYVATPAEILAAAANLDGAEVHQVSIGDDGELQVNPALLLDEGESYLVIPLPDKKETR